MSQLTLAPVASHRAGFFWLVDVLKFDADFSATSQQRQAANLSGRFAREVMPAVQKWAGERGVNCDNLVCKLGRVQQGGRSGIAVHAGLFSVVAQSVMGASTFANSSVDQAAVDALIAKAPAIQVLNAVSIHDEQLGAEYQGNSGGEHVGQVEEGTLEESATKSVTDASEIDADDDHARHNVCNAHQGSEVATTSLTFQDIMSRVRQVKSGPLRGYGSVLDVLQIVTDGKNVRSTWARMKDSVAGCYTYIFPATHQKTPVADVDTLIQIVWDCPGVIVRAFRRQCPSKIACSAESFMKQTKAGVYISAPDCNVNTPRAFQSNCMMTRHGVNDMCRSAHGSIELAKYEIRQDSLLQLLKKA